MKPETPMSESKEAAVTREEKKERKVSIPILDLQMGNPEKNTEEETEEGKRSLIFLFLTLGLSLSGLDSPFFFLFLSNGK